MKCGECEKKLKGGFKQEDGTFRCARCVIHKVERDTDKYAAGMIVALCNEVLTPGRRPTKANLRIVRGWAKAIVSRS